MILPNLSEERILEELVFDQKRVATDAKKIATKAITHLQRAGRDGIDDDIYYFCDITTSKQRNNWKAMIVVNMAKSPKWYHQSVCYVESEYGTRDFYLLRGLADRKPYFIRISSHTIKRVRERFIGEKLHVDVNFDTANLPLMVIRKGEIIPWMKITSPQLMKLAMEIDDRHKLCTLFYTYYGCYLGYETEHGNVVFKTFLNNAEKLKGNDETLALCMCRIGHVGLNPKLYPKDYREAIFKGEVQMSKDMEDTLYGFKDKYRLLP